MINDLVVVIMLLSVLLVLHIINTILGIVINTKSNKFSIKKFKRGVIKALLFCICFIAYCFCLEIFPIVLLRINIVISNDVITILEIIGIISTAYKKYAVDCYEKIKIILKIKDSI